MKIVVSTLGPTLDDRVDERFGRAMTLLCVETETMTAEAIDNSANRNAMQGAGLGAAETVSDSGAQAVITGHLGPKAYRALKAVDIGGYCGSGMIARDAVNAYLDGRLAALDEGTAHAGMG